MQQVAEVFDTVYEKIFLSNCTRWNLKLKLKQINVS